MTTSIRRCVGKRECSQRIVLNKLNWSGVQIISNFTSRFARSPILLKMKSSSPLIFIIHNTRQYITRRYVVRQTDKQTDRQTWMNTDRLTDTQTHNTINKTISHSALLSIYEPFNKPYKQWTQDQIPLQSSNCSNCFVYFFIIDSTSFFTSILFLLYRAWLYSPIVCISAIPHSRSTLVLYSAVKCNIVQYSTVQYSTVQ